MTIFELYKKYGIRDINNYSKPKTGSIEEMPVSKDMAYYYPGSFTDAVPREEGWLLDGTKEVTVFTPDKFTKFVGKGSKVLSLSRVMKPYTRTSEKFVYVKNIGKLDNVSTNHPVVINYAHLKKMYKYPKYVAKDFNIFASTMGSLVSDVTKGIVDRTTFIDIALPFSLETINEYVNLLKKGNNYYIKHYNTFEEFTLFELIKFIMYDHRDNSLFKPLIEVENKKNMFFVIRTTKRFTLINLHDLLAMDNKNVDTKLKMTGKDSLKLLLRFLLTFMLGSEEEIDDKDIDKKILDLKDKVVIPTVKPKPIVMKNPEEAAIDAVNTNVSKGVMSEKHADKMKAVIKKQKIDKSRSKEEYDLKDDDINLSDSPIVFNKAALKDPIGARDKKYLAEYYEKDVSRMVGHLSASGVLAVESHTVESTNNKINSIDTHVIVVTQANGRNKSLIRHVPKPNKDGVLRLNNNEYILLKQKADRPIRKINNTKVALSSYFGKLMINRGKYSKDNLSKGFYRLLKSLNDDDTEPLNLLVEGKGKFSNVELPYWYTRTANTVRSFIIDDMFFTFDYNNRRKHIKDIESVEKHGTFIGIKGKSTPLVIKGDMLYKIVNDKAEEIGLYLDVLNIDEDKLPLEMSSISIRGKSVPLVLPILAHMSLEQLLEILNVRHTIHPSIRESKVEKGQYVISFKDKIYKFYREDREATLLLSGLHSIRKELKFYTVEDISSSTGFGELYSMLGYNKGDINEIGLLYSMFIDPLTADILKLMNEPVEFHKLLLRANELLVTDSFKAINNMDEIMLKSYERLAGMVYHSFVKEIRVYKNSLGIANKSMTSDPYAVMRMLNEDGSRELIEDINPIASLKQRENTTLTGFLGRSKDSIPIEAREIDITEIGFISEASKESAAVGITAYMSSSPSIDNMSGLNKSPDKLTAYNVSSTATNLSPFGETDDGKRKLFNSVQAGHVIALDKQRVMPILTGYEAVLGERVSDKFVTSAEDDGKVVSVSKSKIVVKYNKLGTKSYSVKDWFSKETSGESFRHIMKTIPLKGERFKKGATLVYDTLFFGPNVFDKSKVLYKTGMPARIAFFEDIINYEDSAGISSKFSKEGSVKLIKVRSLIIDGENTLIDFRKIGERVEYTTPLTVNRNVGDLKDKSSNMKGKTLDILKDLVSDTPKAEVEGVIKDIIIYYRKDIKEYKGELKKLIEDSDARMLEAYGYTGKVDHTYSIKGVPLELTDIEIKYYIEYKLDMIHRDKGILQNQLKFTVGDIYESILTSDGKEVDITMSPTSVDARVVDSAYRSLTTTTLMMALTETVIEMWES